MHMYHTGMEGTYARSTGRQLVEDASNVIVVSLVKSEHLDRSDDIDADH